MLQSKTWQLQTEENSQVQTKLNLVGAVNLLLFSLFTREENNRHSWSRFYKSWDGYRNPGQENVSHGGYFNQKCNSREANSIANRVIYSRQQLYGLKWKSSLPSFLFQYLQSLGLIKNRRCRGGKSVIR